MIGRKPRVMVNAFRRVFGGAREERPAETSAEAPLVLAALPGPAGLELTWERTRMLRGEWRLGGEGGTYATLRAKGGRDFEARTADAEWTLRGDWGASSVKVRRGADSEPTVRFAQQFFTRDRIERTAGETLRWDAALFGSHWRLETEDGRVLVAVDSRGTWRARRVVSVHEGARSLPDLPALMLLTLVLPELAERRSHAAH